MTERKIKYMTTYGTCIDRVEVVGETKKFFLLPNGHRHKKLSGWHKYFDSWEDARRSIIDRMKEHVERALKQVVEAEEDLKSAEAIPTKEV